MLKYMTYGPWFANMFTFLEQLHFCYTYNIRSGKKSLHRTTEKFMEIAYSEKAMHGFQNFFTPKYICFPF